MIQSPNQPRARDTQPLHASFVRARSAESREGLRRGKATHVIFGFRRHAHIHVLCIIAQQLHLMTATSTSSSCACCSRVHIAQCKFNATCRCRQVQVYALRALLIYIYESICFQTWEGWPNDMYTYIDTEHNNQIDWFVNYPDLALNMMWWQDNIRVICRPLPNWEIVYECVMWDVMGWGSLVMWVPAIGSDEAYSYCFCASSYTTRYALINCQWWGLIGVMDDNDAFEVFKRWMIICNELIVFLYLHNTLTEQ